MNCFYSSHIWHTPWSKFLWDHYRRLQCIHQRKRCVLNALVYSYFKILQGLDYCIGIAFEFQTHFIAFLTLDQVFQTCLYYIYDFLFTSHFFLWPNWAITLGDLPCPPANVYKKPYVNFLSTVADRIESQANLRCTGLTCDVMQGSAGNKFWGGVGVYTIPEIFFDAGKFIYWHLWSKSPKVPIGVSPFPLEKGVFDCPSWTARLCEALWSYAHKSHGDLKYISFYFIISCKL